MPLTSDWIPRNLVEIFVLWQTSLVQYSTIQYNTVQYSTVQYSTVQYSTVQYSTVQYSTVQYSTVQYSTVQYSTVQYSNYISGCNSYKIYPTPYSAVQHSIQITDTWTWSSVQCNCNVVVVSSVWRCEGKGGGETSLLLAHATTLSQVRAKNQAPD